MSNVTGDPMTDSVLILLRVILGVLGVGLFGVVVGLALKGIDRKLAAHMQGRIGPPLRQPFLDVWKLMHKESVVPENAIEFLFNGSPVLAFAVGAIILAYLPVAGFNPIIGYGDAVVVLYLLILLTLAYVVGGFSAGSPFATVGAQREMVMMMSYELPLAAVVVGVAYRLHAWSTSLESFSFTTMVEYPIWSVVGPVGFVGALMLMLVLLIVTPAELAKIPFDTPEAETELGAGLFTEYSGRNLGMFYLADAVKMVVMATIVVTIFFPYTLNDVIRNFGVELIVDTASEPVWTAVSGVLEMLWFLFKLFVVVFVTVTFVRVSFSRLRIDQVSGLYFKYVGLLSIVGIALLMVDVGL